MRIAATLNGAPQYVASVQGAGYLSAHLNCANRPKENESKRVLRVEGFDTNSPTETVSLKWPEVPLSPGDVVQLQVLEEGPGDAPALRRTTSELPTNLLSDSNLAEELLGICGEFEKRLLEFMHRAQAIEPEDEHLNLKRAVGSIVVNLGEDLLSPIYRRHPGLVPDDMRGELL
jgi:hypothetical protein